MTIWAPAVLTSFAGAMVALPLAPALRELRRPRDAAALPIQQHDAKIDNFALAFRARIEPLQSLLADAVAQNACRYFPFADQQRVLLIGTVPGDPSVPYPHDAEAITLFGRPVLLPDSLSFRRELYAAASLCSGRQNQFRAILCHGDVYLGEGSRVLRWIHATRHLSAASGCSLHGRASANQSILLAPGCAFERMYAPTIATGPEPTAGEHNAEFAAGSTIDRRLGRFRIRGELRLRDGEVLQGNLIARCIRLAEQCFVVGSLKAGRDVVIESGTRIDGSIIAGTTVHIGDGCCIRGPVLAEGTISIGRSARIGSIGQPTTVSAPRIHLHSGSVVHGTVWARNQGRVEA